MTSKLVFRPPLVLDTHAGDAAKNFPISLHIYSSVSDKTALYRLRYRAFRDAGWIDEDPSEEFADRFDELPSTYAVAAFHDGSCIGSLRLAFGGSGYSPDTMPCEGPFKTEVRAVDVSRRFRMVEFSRMAVEPSLTNRSFRTTLYASLVRAGVIVSTAAEADIALIAVHRRISPFYQAMCGFKVAGKSDSYAGIAEPTHFLALRFSELQARRHRSNAFFAFSTDELNSARHAIQTMQKKSAA